MATLQVADAEAVNQLGYRMLGGFGAGDVWAVTELFRLNTKRHPEWANGWDSYGEALARRGDLDAALAAYRRALELDPGLPTAQSALVVLTAYRGDVAGALRLGDSILAAARVRADTGAMREALATRSAVFLASGRWDEAAAEARERRRLKSPEGDGEIQSLLEHSYWDDHLLRNIWLEAGEVDRADSIQVAAMAHAEGTGGSESILRAIRLDDAFYRASAAVRRRQWEAALEIAAPLRVQPSSYGNVVAKALLGLGRPREAADTLLALTRDGYYRRYLLARASLALGDSARARDLLRDVTTWNQLGAWFWLHEYAIRRRDALALLDSIGVIRVIGVIGDEGATGGLAARAQATADSASATLKVANAAAANQLGYTMLGGLFGAGDVWGSTEVFRINTERYPEWANGWDSYAEALARRGDLDAAVAAYRRALELDPRLPTAQSGLVIVTAYGGDLGRALAINDSILAVGETWADTAGLRENLATRAAALAGAGRWRDAVAVLERRTRLSSYNDGNVSRILDHSYWDDHLIRNIWLAAREFALADSVEQAALARAERVGGTERVLGAIRKNHDFYRAEVSLARGDWGRALELAPEGNARARAYVGLGRLDAADSLLADLPDGYYRRAIAARVELTRGDTARARDLLRDVVTWHQLGNRFWLHEYAITGWWEARVLLDSIAVRWDEWTSRSRGTPVASSPPFPRSHPSWSPDGSWIAFDAAPNGNWDVFVVRPDGSGLRRLTEASGRDVGPRWHPDSHRLYFLSDRRDGRTLEPFELDITTAEIRAFSLREFGAVEPWFSPDGRRVAFHRRDDEGVKLWWAAADGSGARPVSGGAPLIANPVWSSDGKSLAFSEGESPTFRIRVVDHDGRTVLSVPHDGTGRDVPRELDLEAGVLLFHSDRDQPNVFQTYLYDVATGETRQLTFGPHLNGVPSFSPDRRTILFESNRDGIVDLYLMELDGRREVRRILPAER